MAMGEFELIQRYFATLTSSHEGVELGVGDDAAILSLPVGEHLVVTVDTSNADVHFPADADAFAIGYRALAVNLSDLAAMGAAPRWYTLSLTLPAVEEAWLVRFSEGLAKISNEFSVALVGGDTTRGVLALSIQAMGAVPHGQALCRHGARSGDLVYVSGTLGDAAAGLACYQQRLRLDETAREFLLGRYLRPTPRVALGLALRGIASSCIDISDGLLADVGHIAERSRVAITLHAQCLPSSVALHQLSVEQRRAFQLAGGDDYELCFTVPPQKSSDVQRIAAQLALPLTCIGEVCEGSGVCCVDESGSDVAQRVTGYTHF